MWHDDHSEEVTQGPSQRFLSCKARRDVSVKRMKRSRKVPGSPIAQSKLESSGLEGFVVDPICGGNHPCVLYRRCQTEFPGSEVGRGLQSQSTGGGDLLRTGATPEAWDKTFHFAVCSDAIRTTDLRKDIIWFLIHENLNWFYAPCALGGDKVHSLNVFATVRNLPKRLFSHF